MSDEMSDYVPFEPRTDAQRARKREVRAVLDQLVVPADHLLHASYHRAVPHGADVENVLLYNIGGLGLQRAMAGGVRFEAGPDDPSTDAFSYQAAPLSGGFDHWDDVGTVAAFRDIPLDGVSLSDVWWALSQAQVDRAHDLAQGAAFGLRLHLSGPAGRLTIETVKSIGDGVVCALQSQTGTKDLAECARRIAARQSLREEDVQAALVDSSRAALGTVPRLVGLRGTHVQWAPQDDRCVAAEVRFTAATSWSLTGAVFAAQTREARA